MKLRNLAYVSAIATCISYSALAGELPRANQPEDVGLSSERLQRVTAVFQSEVDNSKIPGAVVLILRKGKVAYLAAIGFQDREKKLPMKADTIFRIASMTKPVVSVAIMLLVEEGKIQLSTPASAFLPEFKNLMVGVEKINAATGKPELVLEPARRQMTIQDLLRHTSGLTYPFFGDSLVKQAYRNAGVMAPNLTLAEVVAKLSQLPLAFQPGTTFEYGISTDVLGRIVEVVSGKGLDEFIAERITKPLGMPDTAFYATSAQAARVAQPQIDPATGRRTPMRDVSIRPNWMSGGGGMISTAADYARFSQMLLNKGELDGVRLLSPRTVEYMTSDHLPLGTAMSPAVLGFGSLLPSPAQGQGFGLGFAVRTSAGRNSLPGSPGEFYWVGASGTTFWVDPKQELVAIMMVQLPLAAGAHYRSLIRNMVYQAVVN